MAVIFTDPFWQFLDSNGDPLADGYIFTYSAGTTTLKDTFTTDDASVTNPNPIPLDSAGRPENQIWIQGSYRFDLYDANDALVKSIDDVTSFTTLNESGDPFFQSFSGDGSQTVFTLSESLGDDSKDIMVFVNNESGDVGYDIQSPSAYTLSGTSLTFTTAPPSGTNNVYVYAPTKLLGAASAAAAAAEAAETSAVAAKNDAEAAAGVVEMTSTTSVEIGTGSKVFTVSSGLSVTAGQWVIITSDANPLVNYMTGQIASYSGTTLTITVAAAFGSGTLADWTIKLSGVRGAQGVQGTVGNAGAATLDINADEVLFLDSSDSDALSKGVLSIASQVEAEAGTATDKLMTPQRTKQAIDELAGGGWVPIQTQEVTSAVASVDFTTGIDGTYDTYMIKGHGILLTSTNSRLEALLSSDGGSTYISANYALTSRYLDLDTGAETASIDSENYTKFEMFRFSSTTYPASFSLLLNNLRDATRKGLLSESFGNVNDNTSGADSISTASRCYLKDTSIIDAIRIQGTTDITAGTFTLYGLAGA